MTSTPKELGEAIRALLETTECTGLEVLQSLGAETALFMAEAEANSNVAIETQQQVFELYFNTAMEQIKASGFHEVSPANDTVN